MKNTEYKDIFDFGEEALSMEDKFSAPSFPSFKNAFTLGENIRGMTNVSPLATMKFFNQTSDDVLTKYYPDSENVQKGNTNVITDADISNSELNRFEENYYFDNNHNGKFGDSGDILAFKLVLFISTDGLKIRESYEVTEPRNDEVMLFLETDGGLSKQVLFGKMSEKVRKKFTDKNGNLESNLYDNEILKGVRKYYKDANQEVIEKLIKNGYIEESIIKEGFFKVLKYLGIATNALPKIIGWILEKLGSWIDYLKIDEQFWDTENENYFLKKENLIVNFTISTETIKKIEELLNNKDDLSVTDLMPEAIEEGIQYILSKTKTTIEQYNEFVKEKIEELYNDFDNPTSNFIFKDLAEGFAFLCGIWNGAVDFISGTFKFAAALLQAPFNIVNDFQTTLELVDNFWDTITTKIFWVNLWESIKETYTKIKNELTNLDSANFNWVKIAYFTGFGLATIASFFIPMAQIANVAKAGKIGEIIAKFTSEISSGFVKGANIIGQKSAQAYKNSLKIFREMLALFSQGKKKLTAFFENIWKKIVEWFKKNKKLLLYEGTGNEIRSTLAKIVDIAQDIVPLEILQYEKHIFDFPTEWAGMITKDGEIIKNITSNSSKAVDIIAKYGEKLENAIVTHNHPRGNSLSTGDIRLFMFKGLKELRAVARTDESIFVLRNLGEKLSTSELREIQKAVVKAIANKKGTNIFSNSLDVADEYINELMKYKNRFEYIHYKKP